MTEKNKKNKKIIPIGMTLIETMMAITIMLIGMEGFTLLFGRAWRTNSYTLEMGQASMAASQGVGKMVNYVRGARQADSGAYPVKSASGNDLVVYSDFDKDNVTERLHFYKSGQDIILGVTEPSGTMPKSYQDGDQTTAIIANHVINDASVPVFQYFDSNFAGDETANPPLNVPIDASKIRIIKIHLKINIDPNRAPDNIEAQSFVELRNLNDYDRIQ